MTITTLRSRFFDITVHRHQSRFIPGLMTPSDGIFKVGREPESYRYSTSQFFSYLTQPRADIVWKALGKQKKINKNTVERRAAFCKWSNQLCQAKETKSCSLMRRTPMVSHMCVIRGSWRRRTCLLKQREKQTESGVISIDLIIIIFPFVIMLMVTKHHFSI